MANTLDMTKGRITGLLVRFAVPLLLSNILQVFYTLADSVVVGRLLGVNAFAAIGASWFTYWLLLSTILGISQGFGTLFAQRFGAKDLPALRRAFATAFLLVAAGGAALSVGGALLSEPALRWLQTPADIVEDAAVYLRILTGGAWIAFAYNLLGAMLRGLGDSKTPLQAMIISSLLNIVLDVVLIAVIPLGVAGVGMATLLAQAAACAYCLYRLRRVPEARLTRADFAWDPASARALLRLGAPLGFRNCVISVGGLAVQYAINGYGTVFVAGITAARRVSDLLWMIGGALDGAIATFVAQNYGARQLARIRRGVAAGRNMLLVSAAGILALALLFGRLLLGLFLAGDVEQVGAVLDVAQRQLVVTALGVPVLFMLFLYRSALQGLGNALIPMLSGFLELALRVACVLLFSSLLGEWSVYLADAAGWAAAAPLLYVAYVVVFRRRNS